jgi:hypothetical protein
MTNANNKDNISACAVNELLGFVANGKDRTTITFEQTENGCMEEARFSLRRRITQVWGFERKRVIPLEASMKQRFELGGMQFNVYDSVQFSVNGKGWSTDFKTIARDTAYDVQD